MPRPESRSSLFDGAPGVRGTHQSLKEMALDYIRDGVISGRLTPGTRIDQDQIADELRTSRLPVREALIDLTPRGFVESFPRRGAFVAKLTVKDINDHFEMTSLLFGMTVRRAANCITPKQLDNLQKLHTEACTTQDSSKRLELTYEFYRIINHLDTSERLLRTIQFLAVALPNEFYFSTPRWPATETVYRERVLTALKNHDAEAAVEATREHLRACADVTIDELRSRGYWSQSETVAQSSRMTRHDHHLDSGNGPSGCSICR